MFELFEKDRLSAGVEDIHAFWEPLFEKRGGRSPSVEETVEGLWRLRGELEPFVRDTLVFLHEEIRRAASILLEGAQGTLLDIDHGTYPFVTSSNASIAGALSGSGIGPLDIDAVTGITKAYCTRVGEGPFPTEAEPDAASRLREAGGEFGSTTGRPRRCGWLDLPALRRSGRLNSARSLALTKVDVLTGLDEIPVCIAYEVGGRTVTDFPIDELHRASPVYERWPGWKEDIRGVRDFDDLPRNLQRYIQNIEVKTEMEISLISVGPARNETIVRKNPLR